MRQRKNKLPIRVGPLWIAPAQTKEERFHRIEAMSQRIMEYVQFLRELEEWKGASDEAKHNAIDRFYEQMTDLERKLGRILEDLQIG